ncbi:MAG: hypothetical protein SOI13_01385 [Bifidobacterium mongoliense]|uniref:hypothetical protein n=1 Tax=Bifidobacterium mongoliense TaxID=518643 RepID=UPI002F35F113
MEVIPNGAITDVDAMKPGMKVVCRVGPGLYLASYEILAVNKYSYTPLRVRTDSPVEQWVSRGDICYALPAGCPNEAMEIVTDVMKVKTDDTAYFKNDPHGYKVVRVDDDRVCARLMVDATSSLFANMAYNWGIISMLNSAFDHATRPRLQWPADPTDGETHWYKGVDGKVYEYRPHHEYEWADVAEANSDHRSEFARRFHDSLPLTEMKLVPKGGE